MGHANLPEVVARLARDLDPATPAAAISWGTMPHQKVVRSRLAGICEAVDAAGLSAPMVLVVGATTQALEAPEWLAARRPLLGRRILLTRPREAAIHLPAAGRAAERPPAASRPTAASRLAELGAEVLIVPTIRIVPLDPAPLDRRLTSAERWSGLLLTSPRAVAILAERVFAVGRDARIFAGIKIFAIGPSTARALRDRLGLSADFVPPRYDSDALLETILAAYGGNVERRRFLFPRALEGREDLPAGLGARGAVVDLVPLYRTENDPEVPEKIKRILAERPPDLVTFTASSTVRGLLEGLDETTREALRRIPAVAIGPVTAATARAAGFSLREADEATIEGLVQKILEG
jgi:uroporphyrinogen III methyltransferase/synthase